MKIIKVVAGDAGGYRCEVTAKDTCDSSTFEISVEGEWKQTLGRGALLRILHALPFWSLKAIICVVGNFSCYSCTSGEPSRYFVCIQKSVSASGISLLSLCGNTWTYILFITFLVCVSRTFSSFLSWIKCVKSVLNTFCFYIQRCWRGWRRSGFQCPAESY